MEKSIDCTVCGTCVVDILIRTVSLDVAIGANRLWPVAPIATTVGGIVSNTGTALARLGLKVAAFSRIGNDPWADILLHHLNAEGINSEGVHRKSGGSTSTTAVLIDKNGERSFAHHPGLAATLNLADIRDNFSLFARSRIVLIGYYSLLPMLEPDLPILLTELRNAHCLTALDSAGSGGDREVLTKLIPYVDFYVPSLAEATHQTGEADPERILRAYRSMGANGLIGVKLGSRGALLSPKPNEFLEAASIRPPGPIRDTTGAGDAFFAGLLAGILRGMDLNLAAQLAAATAAACITGYGATSGLRNWEETTRIAGLN